MRVTGLHWILWVACAQPSNEAELCNAVATSVAIDDQPSCLRFPRGNGLGVDFAAYGVSEKLKGTPWQVMHQNISIACMQKNFFAMLTSAMSCMQC